MNRITNLKMWLTHYVSIVLLVVLFSACANGPHQNQHLVDLPTPRPLQGEPQPNEPEQEPVPQKSSSDYSWLGPAAVIVGAWAVNKMSQDSSGGRECWGCHGTGTLGDDYGKTYTCTTCGGSGRLR